jgi:hypothetical protein
MKDYAELAQWLETRGIGSYFQNEQQLVVSNNNPAIPTSNNFWVTKKGDDWYIATWLPAVYLVAKDQHLGELCETILHASPTAIYSVEESIANRFKLRRLTDSEIDDLDLA